MVAAIEILFEDEYLLAVNKPADLLVHVTRDPDAPNLVDLVQAQVGQRLILFHRLDRDTTGVVLLGKDRRLAKTMMQAFAAHRIRKTYWAVVQGKWQPEWNRLEHVLVKGEMGHWRVAQASETGKTALSTMRLLASTADKSWLEVLPKTGRTHQIRVQCAHQGHPVLGDRMYGTALDASPPMALHALQLDFYHPRTHAAIRIAAPAPAYWKERWLEGLVVLP